MPKRSRSSSASWRRWACVSQPERTVTCADSAGKPDVTSQTCRSCTSTTWCSAASVLPISSGSRSRGAASRSTRPESRRRPKPERSISAATSSAAMPSARPKSVSRMIAPATAVAMKANRSVSTCWKAPSTLRLRRFAPERTSVAAGSHRCRPRRRPGPRLPRPGWLDQPAHPLDRRSAHQRHQRRPVELRGEDLGPLEPNVKPPSGGPGREPGREQRQRDGAGVREHVRGVRQQRERGGQDARPRPPPP